MLALSSVGCVCDYLVVMCRPLSADARPLQTLPSLPSDHLGSVGLSSVGLSSVGRLLTWVVLAEVVLVLVVLAV